MKYKILRIIFSFILLGSVLGALNEYWSGWFILLVAVIYISTILILSTNIRINFFQNSIHSAVGKEGVGLSFDDGPHPNTLKILDILDEYEVKALFFCIGKNIAEYPEIYREIIKRGHVVGNHTFSHSRKFGFLSTHAIISEIQQCDRIATEVAGLKTKLFRPPFGVINPKVSRAILATGHITVGWSVRSYDAITSSPDKIYQRITKDLKAGDLILLHDNIPQSAKVLEQLLVFLKQKNLTAIRPDHLLDIDAYS
ncbi:polysaccharide deacetylase family protein [uncultured Christiangramia sp.]|uniref:polysaccharide deacetylase family protein n=1 Tax=uncultured Christiangramia sp. TaxID=503836 RepID=UPI0025E9EAFB|nr:polysaccharide deacetylase family protein [uncultured Christiangramia sp.]